MREQPKKPERTDTAAGKPAAKKAYRKPVVRTEPATERVVLAASSGCGTSIDEESGCDFAV